MLTPVAHVTGLVSRGVSVTSIMSSTLLSVPVSNYTYLTADLRGNIQTTGMLQVEGGSEIGFYIMNAGNFSEWRHGYPSMTALAKPDAINYNFTFVPNGSGVYYFIFSNQDPSHKNVLFTLNIVENTEIPSPFIQYADFEMLIIGILFTIIGIKTGKKSARRSSMEDDAAKCKFCGKRLATGEMFCPKCGRSQN